MKWTSAPLPTNNESYQNMSLSIEKNQNISDEKNVLI